MNTNPRNESTDWRRTMAQPLTQRDDEPRRVQPKSLHATRQHRRRNQYTPIVERGWFLILIGAVAIGLLVAASQGWLV